MQYKILIDGELEHVQTFDGIAPFVDSIGINYLLSTLNLNPADYQMKIYRDDFKGWSTVISLTSLHKPTPVTADWDDQDHTVF